MSNPRSRLTIEHVRDVFGKRGWEVLSTEYVSAHVLLEYRCDAGHVNFMSYANCYSGNGCPTCRSSKNLLSEHYPEVFSQIHPDLNPGVDFSKITCGSSVLLTWLCEKCGNIWKSCPNSRLSTRKVHRCPKCRGCGPIKACEYCGVVVEKFTQKTGKFTGVCKKCWEKFFRKQRECSRCGNIGRIVLCDGTDSICYMCYEKDYRPRCKCDVCGQSEVINKILENGSKVCKKCYGKYYIPEEECSVCGKIKKVTYRDIEKPVCITCYQKHFRELKKCSICGNFRPANKMEGDVIYCAACYRKVYAPEVKCSICGEQCKSVKKTVDGPVCIKCYQREFCKKEKCIVCGKIKKVNKRTDLGPVCMNCHIKRRYKEDEKFRTVRKIRERIRAFVKIHEFGQAKMRKFRNDNIDYVSIVEALGPQPGSDYHIDHIFPLSAFDLNDEVHFRAAVAPENHQWLLSHDNISKNAKYDETTFFTYIEKFK